MARYVSTKTVCEVLGELEQSLEINAEQRLEEGGQRDLNIGCATGYQRVAARLRKLIDGFANGEYL